MSLYDRDYSRDDVGGGFWKSRGLLFGLSAVWTLILLNVAVWIVWTIAGESPALEEHFTFSRPGLFAYYRIWTLITNTFSHQDPSHLFYNMLFLYVFGEQLEQDLYGPKDIFCLYLFSGLLGTLGYLTYAQIQHVDTPVLGASGAVMGLLVLCALHFPDRPINIFGIIPVPLKILAVLYIALDIASLFKHDHVAHAAHLAGGLMGLLYWKFDLRLFKQGRGTPFRSSAASSLGWWARFRNLFRRKPKLKVVERRPPADDAIGMRVHTSSSVDPETSARVDQLLKKISDQGIGALSPDERLFLENASRKYKKD